MNSIAQEDYKKVLDFVLEYGGDGDLPNMDKGGSGDIAYQSALRVQKHGMDTPKTKREILIKLTDLFYVANENNWEHIASAISTAEDVVIHELMHEETGDE